MPGGWTARFFVSPTTPPSNLLGEPVARHGADLGVNARLARQIGFGTRLSVDFTNMFERSPPTTTESLLAPAAGRGIRIGLRKTY